MISRRSLFYFGTTNLFLLGLGTLQHFVRNASNLGCLGTYQGLLLRNIFMTWMLDQNTQHYPWIEAGERGERDHSDLETFLYDVGVTTLIETIGVEWVLRYVVLEETRGWNVDLGTLLGVALLFEILFDLFHYLIHRALHHRAIYAWIHKKHHEHHAPTVYSTYHHHPIDLLLTNVLPMVISLYGVQQLFGGISPLVFHCLHTYKEYIEISGHSGRDIRKTGSFVQCIWIPRLMGIALYTADHDLHHQRSHCNYGKRFSLWDRFFGTFCRERIGEENRDKNRDGSSWDLSTIWWGIFPG